MAKTTMANLNPEPKPEPETNPEQEPGVNPEPDPEINPAPEPATNPDAEGASARSASGSDSDSYSHSASDTEPATDGWLGDFGRGPAVFSLHRLGVESGAHPLVAPEYRIECNDGAGPRVICRFTDEPEAVPEWFGAWRSDEWCDWILDQSRKLIADPQNT
jgi:hypothetical protein